MNKIVVLFKLLLFVLVFITFSCNNVSNYEGEIIIDFTAFKDHGCGNLPKIKIAAADSILSYDYRNGQLKILLEFTTLCEAVMQDSISYDNNELKLFIKNVSDKIVRCVCIYHEEFVFQVSQTGDLFVQFYFCPNTKNEYSLMAESTIPLP